MKGTNLMADSFKGLLDVHDIGSPHGVQHEWESSFLQLLALARHL